MPEEELVVEEQEEREPEPEPTLRRRRMRRRKGLPGMEDGREGSGRSEGDGERAGAADLISLIPRQLSILPLRDNVLFPALVAPLTVTREASVRLIDDAAVAENRIIGITTLLDPGVETPTFADLHPIGVAAAIRMLVKNDQGARLIVHGLHRIRLLRPSQEDPYIRAWVEPITDIRPTTPEEEVEVQALVRSLSAAFQKVVHMSPTLPDQLAELPNHVQDPSPLADLITAHLPLPSPEKQEILEELDVRSRLRRVNAVVTRELSVLEVHSKIQEEVSSEMGRMQKEYFLREQIKVIQKELGEGDERQAEVQELREKIDAAGMTEEAKKEADRELDRLQRMPPAAAEYTVSRTYLDWLTSLPWQASTTDNLDIPAVRDVLDTDHYGLEKVKDRLLEYLSVRKFKAEGDIRQPILCFHGPPGVGKTSLGKSIARAMGRKFVRFSLGGMRDEAEIRGHRRTYIGALPGQIIQGIRRAGSRNPVIMLDEVDKVGQDFRGDPSSALLEVLDPEQNVDFRDHYLDVAFDLSKVLFITTANVLDTVLPPLRDRMETIDLAGYTEEEKQEIAHRHLIPKQTEEHGLSPERIDWDREATRLLIRGYTREAGVRNLEREIAAITRKATREFAEGREEQVLVTTEQVRKYLGSPRFEFEEVQDRVSHPGVAIGLAWTAFGGDILFIEALALPEGKGNLQLTGQLGDVMKESAAAALSLVRSQCPELCQDAGFFQKHDIHVHLPAGSIPKDGPSAGVAICAAIASLASGKKARPRVAMTGEVTLSGRVLPVGGIKEKALAARRAGIRDMILPERNRKDVEEDVPEIVRNSLQFHYVSEVREALGLSLEGAAGGVEGAPDCAPCEADAPGPRRKPRAPRRKAETLPALEA